MPDRIPLLILGLGNPLCTDDGLGVVAISQLRQRFELPEGVVVLEGGTLGLALLPYFEQARTAILVDAIRADLPSGSLVQLDGDEVAPAVRDRLSVHQVGVADLLDGARWLNRYPDHVVLLGLVPQSYALGVGCSSVVEDALPQLVGRVVDEARRFGFELAPRTDGDPADPARDFDLPRVLGL
jgi:hydrogenase maturation protease